MDGIMMTKIIEKYQQRLRCVEAQIEAAKIAESMGEDVQTWLEDLEFLKSEYEKELEWWTRTKAKEDVTDRLEKVFKKHTKMIPRAAKGDEYAVKTIEKCMAEEEKLLDKLTEMIVKEEVSA